MLDKIIAHKKQVLKSRELEINSYKNNLEPAHKNMREALKNHKRSFICEIKPGSPSQGIIRKNINISDIARIYEPFADAMSVLAEEKFFMGALGNVKLVSKEQACPVLCKDFIISPLQVYEARYYGADAILLMLSVLDDEVYKQCEKIAQKLNMSVICETHNHEEILRANKLGAQIVGINNRNFGNLKIDLSTALRLRPLVHDQALVIAESGFKTHQEIERYDGIVDGFLVGTSLMRQERIDLALRELIFGRVKICGLGSAHDARLAYESGAYYGGLNFSPSSKRFISKEDAKIIIKGAPLLYGGIFVNQSIEEITYLAQELALSFVQLHGDENEDYIRELKRFLMPQCEIWQAFRIKDEISEEAYKSTADLILFDSLSEHAYGGTGKAFNWALCENFKSAFGLAGGINANNIRRAASHKAFILDIASGAEDGDHRRKSPMRLKEIFSRLRGD